MCGSHGREQEHLIVVSLCQGVFSNITYQSINGQPLRMGDEETINTLTFKTQTAWTNRLRQIPHRIISDSLNIPWKVRYPAIPGGPIANLTTT